MTVECVIVGVLAFCVGLIAGIVCRWFRDDNKSEVDYYKTRLECEERNAEKMGEFIDSVFSLVESSEYAKNRRMAILTFNACAANRGQKEKR